MKVSFQEYVLNKNLELYGECIVSKNIAVYTKEKYILGSEINGYKIDHYKFWIIDSSKQMAYGAENLEIVLLYLNDLLSKDQH